jgi:hypothetical protein
MGYYACEQCGKEFKKLHDFNSHKKRVTPCARVASTMDMSEKYMKKPYCCRFCNRRFDTRSGIYNHFRFICKAISPFLPKDAETLSTHIMVNKLDEKNHIPPAKKIKALSAESAKRSKIQAGGTVFYEEESAPHKEKLVVPHEEEIVSHEEEPAFRDERATKCYIKHKNELPYKPNTFSVEKFYQNMNTLYPCTAQAVQLPSQQTYITPNKSDICLWDINNNSIQHDVAI